jgi:phage tail sheath protein FI
MGQYLTPGVYIEEVPGAKPIAGVGTATGAFVGIAEKGPIGEAKLITNWTQFKETFGGFVPFGYLAYAVNQFFAEGGTRCYVVRTCHYDYENPAVPDLSGTGDVTLNDSSPAATLNIEALSPGSWSDHLWIEIAAATKDPVNKFRLVVWYKNYELEAYEELTKNDVVQKITGTSKYIKVSHSGTSVLPPAPSALVVNDRATPTAKPTLEITALNFLVTVSIVNQGTKNSTKKFGIIVFHNSIVVETFMNLKLTDMKYKLNGVSNFIKVKDLESDSPSSTKLPASASTVLNDSAPMETLSITALIAGLNYEVTHNIDGTFNLLITGGATETFSNLTMDTVEGVINGVSPNIFVKDLESTTTSPGNRPAAASGSLTAPAGTTLNFFLLTGGEDGLAEGTVLQDTTPADSLQVNAFRDGVQVKIEDASSGSSKFKMTVIVNGTETEVYDELLMESVENTINGTSRYIEVIKAGTTRPENTTEDQDVLTGLADMDFIGDEAKQNGLHAFDKVDDINIVAIPDRPGDREVIQLAYTYCENRRDCFFVADPPFGLDPTGVLAFKEGDASYGSGEYAGNGFNSSYGALYYPWISIIDPLTGKNKFVPPSGAIVGTYSYTDVQRGVHKAPAGTLDGYLNTAVGIGRNVTRGEQELLNPNHINVIRIFPTSGIVVWGARTLSADPEWRYVNVRRLLLFIEESIYNGTQWVVFEPNDRSLWASVKRDVSSFLSIVWRTGALFGSTADEAFYVKIDDENNPQETRDAGQLIIDIGVAPVKPAEFVIFRIAQKTQATG